MQKEKRTYVIGNHEFDSFNEYREAQEDLRKIDVINRELNVHDPEVAIRLYNMMRDGQITFYTPIGDEFFKHVADIVADKSVNLLDNKAIVEEAKRKSRRQRRLGFFVISFALVLIGLFAYSQVGDILTTRQQERMAAERKEAIEEGDARAAIASANAKALAASSIDRKDPFAERKTVDVSTLSILPEYESLYAKNSDLVGWISIEDTDIDYPVVQSDDNDFYLRRNFDKNTDNNGAIFMDYRSDAVNVTTNTILYGHNMNSGLMFGGLSKYLEEDYYNKHKTIKFNSIYVEKEYEVVAVCLSQVANQTDNNFRYYNFIQAENEAQWAAFVDNINALSIFTGHVDLEVGDEVLTLSTCNNYIEDGRLFLVAKRKNM